MFKYVVLSQQLGPMVIKSSRNNLQGGLTKVLPYKFIQQTYLPNNLAVSTTYLVQLGTFLKSTGNSSSARIVPLDCGAFFHFFQRRFRPLLPGSRFFTTFQIPFESRCRIISGSSLKFNQKSVLLILQRYKTLWWLHKLVV